MIQRDQVTGWPNQRSHASTQSKFSFPAGQVVWQLASLDPDYKLPTNVIKGISVNDQDSSIHKVQSSINFKGASLPRTRPHSV